MKTVFVNLARGSLLPQELVLSQPLLEYGLQFLTSPLSFDRMEKQLKTILTQASLMFAHSSSELSARVWSSLFCCLPSVLDPWFQHASCRELASNQKLKTQG